ERLALPPESPLAVADAHLVDAADAALVRVQLEVGPVGRVASDDGDVVGRLGKLGRRALDQVCARGVPLERGASPTRPRLSVGPCGLEGPLADQRLELAERFLRGWLVHGRSLLALCARSYSQAQGSGH